MPGPRGSSQHALSLIEVIFRSETRPRFPSPLSCARANSGAGRLRCHLTLSVDTVTCGTEAMTELPRTEETPDCHARWVAMWRQAVSASRPAMGLVELSTTRFIELSQGAA